MKKNILTIVIMAATVLNLVLSVVLVFSVVPAMNKTNKLVDKVATIIDLETEEKDEPAYTVEDLEAYDITFEAKQTLNLKADQGDKDSHFVIIEGITVSFNKKADDYKKVSELIKGANVYVTDAVSEAISQQTISTVNQEAIKKAALEKIQQFYDTKCIVGISLKGFMFQ